MRFMIDRCAGHALSEWLRSQGHDVAESRDRGPDPGDRVLLEWAVNESRILVTIDTDFGELVFAEGAPHSGLVRLPDVPSGERVRLMSDLLDRFSEPLESGAIITVRGGRVRISKAPESSVN